MQRSTRIKCASDDDLLLDLSLRTVDHDVSGGLQKLGLSTRREAADVAARFAADWTVGRPTRRVSHRGSPALARRGLPW
jgi:hypothetical protein